MAVESLGSVQGQNSRGKFRAFTSSSKPFKTQRRPRHHQIRQWGSVIGGRWEGVYFSPADSPQLLIQVPALHAVFVYPREQVQGFGKARGPGGAAPGAPVNEGLPANSGTEATRVFRSHSPSWEKASPEFELQPSCRWYLPMFPFTERTLGYLLSSCRVLCVRFYPKHTLLPKQV